jgi:hypothetical protein
MNVNLYKLRPLEPHLPSDSEVRIKNRKRSHLDSSLSQILHITIINGTAQKSPTTFFQTNHYLPTTATTEWTAVTQNGLQ